MTLVKAIAFLLGATIVVATAQDAPRVLLLGDSIYQQPASEVSKELKGEVEVVFPRIQPGEIRNSSTVLENIEQLLGDGEWDLIHLNVGLGDLVHRAPGMKSFRVLPKHAGGLRTTSPAQYEKNLHALVKRLKATGAKLVWASTTPIRHSTTGVFEKGAAVEYNAIAAKVMTSHGIPINDMHKHVRELIDMTKPAGHGADPFTTDKKPIHAPIVETIRQQLN